jgi:hypothetical protein
MSTTADTTAVVDAYYQADWPSAEPATSRRSGS